MNSNKIHVDLGTITAVCANLDKTIELLDYLEHVPRCNYLARFEYSTKYVSIRQPKKLTIFLNNDFF